ncbi:MAG: hypothetical protein ACJATD_001437 [Alloalcanivorax sp.]
MRAKVLQLFAKRAAEGLYSSRMFDWISQNKDVLNVLIGFATLMVWVVYAQLLYNGYKRQRRPRIVINRGRYKGVDALCLISNMSAESIFVQHIVARLETDKGDYFQDVTELEQNYQEGDEERERQSTSDTPSLSDSTRQGPLGPGEFVHIGAFNSVIERIARCENLRLDQHRDDRAESDQGVVRLQSLTIQLVAIYGSDDYPIGVERRFLIRDLEEGRLLVPATWDSKRLTSRRHRKQVRQLIEQLARDEARD